MKPLLIALLPVAASAGALDCTITTKCGTSGMCVASKEPMRVTQEDGQIAIAGLPGLTDATAFRLGPGGTFELRPPKSAFAAEGTAFDHMAVRFTGTCQRGSL